MRKSQILLGSLALLSMGLYSCSSEEPANNGNNTTVDGDRYMAVRISTAGMGTRAEGDPVYEDAVGNEAQITAENVRFYFFTKDGDAFKMTGSNINADYEATSNMVKPSMITSNKEQDGNEAVLSGTLVLGKPEAGYLGTVPYQVLCVVNGTFANYDNKSLTEVLAEIENAPSVWSSFVMTSSSYSDGTNVVYTSTVADKIETTPEAAQENPVQIYIERLAAKVRVAGLKTWDVQALDEDGNVVDTKFTVFDKDGNPTETSFKVTLTGWTLHHTATEAYGIKHIAANGNYFTGWNLPDYHRSFWSVTKDNLSVASGNYDIADAATFPYGNFETSKPTENIAYCYENTSYPVASASDRSQDATAIVFRGVIEDEQGNPVNLTKWSGVYFLENDLKENIANSWNTDVENKDNQITVDDIYFSEPEANVYKALAKINGVETELGFDNIQRWVDGQTSYYANIKHLGGKFGVVRNHIYDYTLSNVIGLGIPGNDDDTPEEVDTYVAAYINVLTWRVVSNSLILQ